MAGFWSAASINEESRNGGRPLNTLVYPQRRRLGRTDLWLSPIGFGGAPLGGAYGMSEPAEGKRAVHLAIDCGINFFDTAPYYGRTLAEERLGEALAGRRQEVLLATKCARYGLDEFDFSAERIVLSIDESLQRLQTDYVDLFQVHDVEFGDVQQILDETIPTMRKIQEQGKARYIGITGYCLKPLMRIAELAPVDAILSYCHSNLMVGKMDEVLTPFAKEREIGLIHASPLHMGVLTENGAPPWHPAPPQVHEAGRKAAEHCRKRGANLSALALRFALEHPYVSTTLVGMSTRQEVETNLRVLRSEIDRELLAEVNAILAPVFNCTWPSGRVENQD